MPLSYPLGFGGFAGVYVPWCLLIVTEKTKEKGGHLGSPHPGKFLDGLRNKLSPSSADERAATVIRSMPLGRWRSAVTWCSPASIAQMSKYRWCHSQGRAGAMGWKETFGKQNKTI